jgi:predicted RNA binding protein YcfA (HicA-like mRNA interferase family)
MTMQLLRRLPLFRARQQGNRYMPEVSGIDHRSAIAAFEEAGFWVLRQNVHTIMTNGSRILTIPCNDPVHAMTLEGIVRDSGLTLEEFRQLL